MSVLIWKSWRELRWATTAGLAALWVPSIIDGLRRMNGSYDPGFYPDVACTLVGSVGWLFAILIALLAAGSDLKEPLDDFWRSRPIGAFRYGVVKYASGLVALLLVCTIPAAFELWANSANPRYGAWRWGELSNFRGNMVWAAAFPIWLTYSGAFAICCAFPKGLSRAILALGFGMLVHIGPLVIPGIGFLDSYHWYSFEPLYVSPNMRPGIHQIVHFLSLGLPSGLGVQIQNAYLLYAVSMAILSGLAAIVGCLVVARSNRWTADQKTVCWALGSVMLVLFWGASTQLGSNLPGQRVRPLLGFSGTKEASASSKYARAVPTEPVFVDRITYDPQGEGFAVFHRYDRTSAPEIAPVNPNGRIDVASSLRFWLGVDDRTRDSNRLSVSPVKWHPSSRGIAYAILAEYEPSRVQPADRSREIYYDFARLELAAMDLSPDPPRDRVRHFDLKPLLGQKHNQTGTHYGGRPMIFLPVKPHLVVVGDKALVVSLPTDPRRTLVFDLADPLSPTLAHDLEGFQHMLYTPEMWEAGVAPITLSLPDLPGLSDIECLRAKADLGGGTQYEEGRIAVIGDQTGEIRVFRVKDFSLRDGSAHSPEGKLGWFQVSLELESVAHRSALASLLESHVIQATLHRGYLSLLTTGFGRSVSVYDVKAPGGIRKVGHYATGSDWVSSITPRPDGNLVVVGSQLHTIDLPSRESK